MKTLKLNTSINTLTSVLIAAMIMMSCSKNDDVVNPVNLSSGEGSSKSLSAVEQSDLLFMAEKAKLMKNVYQVMFDSYQEDLFATISACKQKHLTLLSARIDKYDVENPIAYMAEDEFSDGSLQQIYDDFIAERPTNQIESLIYLKAMEEKHIADIENSVSQVEGNGDIVTVYNLCLAESEAHLSEILGYTKGFRDIIKPFDPIREH